MMGNKWMGLGLVAFILVTVVSFQNCAGGGGQGDESIQASSRLPDCWKTIGSAVNFQYITPTDTFQISNVNGAASASIVGASASCTSFDPRTLASYNTFKARVNGMSVCVGGGNGQTSLNTDVGGVANPTNATVKPKGATFQQLLQTMDSLLAEAQNKGYCN